MENELILGLRISVLGLAITFLAMGLVILVMVLLMRFFPVRGAADETAQASQPETEAVDEQALEELAVALAVGICLLEQDGAFERKDPSLGKLLEE